MSDDQGTNLLIESQRLSDAVVHMQTHALWIFGVWFALWIAYECYFATGGVRKHWWKTNVLPAWLFVVLILVFVPFELYGAYGNKASGDTFSELIWSFIEAGHARSIIGISIGVALSLRAATIPLIFGGYEKLAIRIVPWWLICAGLAGWLVQHFPELGTQG